MVVGVKVTIVGRRVHGVGYRAFLLYKAVLSDITHFQAFNITLNGKQAVVCMVDGGEESIKEFVNTVKKEFPDKAIVDEVKTEDYHGKIVEIEKYGFALQVEQLSKGIQALLSIDCKQDKMLEKQDKMLEKQDTSLGILRSIDGKIDHVVKVLDSLASLREDVEALKIGQRELREKVDRIISTLKIEI